MSSNPFKDSIGKPLLHTSVVAYLDILGFTESMKKSYEMGRQLDLLSELRQALNEAIIFIGMTSNEEFELVRDEFHIKSFTDSIVVGHPLNPSTKGESELGHLLEDLAGFQLVMATKGFFIRGGISVGEYYQDEDIVYGDGLINAYKVENEIARDPRIVLDENAMTLQKLHFSFYGNPKWATQYSFLRQDADNQVFLCYLNACHIAENQFLDTLVDQHRAQVEDNLQKYINEPRIWSKYLWIANYHNSFCDDDGLENYKIDLKNHTAIPTRIDPNTLPSLRSSGRVTNKPNPPTNT